MKELKVIQSAKMQKLLSHMRTAAGNEEQQSLLLQMVNSSESAASEIAGICVTAPQIRGTGADTSLCQLFRGNCAD